MTRLAAIRWARAVRSLSGSAATSAPMSAGAKRSALAARLAAGPVSGRRRRGRRRSGRGRRGLAGGQRRPAAGRGRDAPRWGRERGDWYVSSANDNVTNCSYPGAVPMRTRPTSPPGYRTQKSMTNGPQDVQDITAIETQEWLDSLEWVIQHGGPERVAQLLDALESYARQKGVPLPFAATTPYINTIGPGQQTPFPGSREIERRIKSLVRWNAMAMVVRANKNSDGIGGHISTFASSATLYEVGFNHFFRGPDHADGGDLVFFQGHASPGIYSRAFLEGRLTQQHLEQLPPRAGRRRRAVLVSAPVAHAELLAGADGVDGPRADHGHLPGALLALPGEPRPEEGHPEQGVGVPRRRRDRRARDARRAHARVAREARQPDLRDQLQPPAPRRPGAWQRLDHPGTRGRVPRRRLERDQGDLGLRVGRPARPRQDRPAVAPHGGDRRRRVPAPVGVQRRLPAREVLRQVPRTARTGEAPLRRPVEEAAARRPRPGEGLRGLQGGDRDQGRADGGAGPHDQGLRPRRVGRRQEPDAPAEEAERRRGPPASGPASTSRSATTTSSRCRSTARRRTAPNWRT